MSKQLAGSRTLENLMKSFAGESQAWARYMMYSKQAEKDGYQQIAGIFEETACNERVHGKRYYEYIVKYAEPSKEILNVRISGDYPVALAEDTLFNLKAAAAGEHEEGDVLYPEYARVAEEEGFKDIAYTFQEIAQGEKVHKQRYLDLADNIEQGIVFKRPQEVVWKCRKCGYHYVGKEAPKKCPACGHPQEYFELFAKNY